MKSLVGYTGFVGSNLAMCGDFDNYYNSKNIADAYGTNPDLLIYAGVPAQKFLANKFPNKDLEVIKNAIENIKKINPKRLVLISTIDVYQKPIDVNEDSLIDLLNSEAYGRNRLYLENWVKNNIKDYLIVRLPGLYGKNIKKNFIYDYIHVIPNMLKEDKFNELCKKGNYISQYYKREDNGFYKLKNISSDEELYLKKYFEKIGFSALNFTDSRGSFQFYNLFYLYNHINIALDNNIRVLNIATEPITISELYRYLNSKDFVNEVSNKIPNYDFKTKYDYVFDGNNGYIFNKEFILEDIKKFINNEMSYKLSISNIAWNENQDGEMLEYLKKSGFKGLEIAPTRVIKERPYDNVKKIKDYAQVLKLKYGLVISSMQSIWYGKAENMFITEKDREELLEYTKKAIDFASAVGCKNLVFGCPKNRNITDKTVNYEKIAIDFFNIVGDYAKSKNVIFSIEANPKIYNTNFINTTKEAIDIVKKINNDGVKVNLDLGTMISNNEDVNILVDNIKYINHIHISEPYLAKIEKRNLHKKLKDILMEEDYNKYVSIEMSNKNSISDVKDTIDYVGRLFR